MHYLHGLSLGQLHHSKYQDPWAVISLTTPDSSPRKLLICFLSLTLPIPESPHKRGHMVDGLFAWLPSCTSVCSWLLRACQQVILLYGQITSVMHHTWMHPLVYICSLINGHLGCFMFWLWWIMLPSTSMYKFMCGCMSSIFLGTYKRRHIVTVRLTSWWAAKLLFLPTAPVYILTSILGGFHFFHLLANIHYGWFFYYTYPCGFEVVFLCGFDSRSP